MVVIFAYNALMSCQYTFIQFEVQWKGLDTAVNIHLVQLSKVYLFAYKPQLTIFQYAFMRNLSCTIPIS